MSDISQSEMPLVGHLKELRSRLIRCVVLFLLVAVVLITVSDDIYSLVSKPLRSFLPSGSTMIATGVASPFLTPFKLASWVSIVICAPYFLYQAWGFIAPGLYKSEKRIAIPLFFSSVFLFYVGILFAYFLVFPVMFEFFASVTPVGVSMMTDINQYLDFILTLFLAFGLAFEIPIATFLLLWVGVVDVTTLRHARPYVIVGCFIVGMVLTPPDPFSQTLLAVPMWLLFELGAFCGRWIKPKETLDDEAIKPSLPKL